MKLRFTSIIIFLAIFAVTLIFINLCTGYIKLDFQDFIFENNKNAQIVELRYCRVLVMLLAGISVPSSGFLLQEYFQNPLAGPDILGISSVAGLCVAVFIFMSPSLILPDFLQNSFLSLSAFLGSLLLMILLIGFSSKFSDKSYIIIFGFLISALAGAIINVMQLYADQQSLKNYTLWSFGANAMVTVGQLLVLIFFTGIAMFFTFKIIKPLIGFSLGESYAKSMGVNIGSLKLLLIIASSLYAASITAFLGPILFIGIIVPHFCRLLYNPSKLWQQWMLNMLLGISLMELFSVISEISKIPINVITSFFGIPVIIFMMLKKKKSFN